MKIDKEEVALQWLTALLSGDYKQTKYRLQKNGGFCCLGVLCDLHRIFEGGEWRDNGISIRYTAAYPKNCGAEGYPPQEVRNWAEINGYKIDRLIHLNDKLGANFNQIAETIEEMTWVEGYHDED